MCAGRSSREIKMALAFIALNASVTSFMPLMPAGLLFGPTTTKSLLGRAIFAGSIAGHEDQGPRAGRLVQEVFTMGLEMFFSAQSRKTSNCGNAVGPSIPICVWPLNLP